MVICGTARRPVLSVIVAVFPLSGSPLLMHVHFKLRSGLDAHASRMHNNQEGAEHVNSTASPILAPLQPSCKTRHKHKYLVLVIARDSLTTPFKPPLTFIPLAHRSRSPRSPQSAITPPRPHVYVQHDHRQPKLSQCFDSRTAISPVYSVINNAEAKGIPEGERRFNPAVLHVVWLGFRSRGWYAVGIRLL